MTTLGLLASPALAMLVGLAGATALIYYHKHRNPDGKISPHKLASAFMTATLVYVLCILVIAEAILAIPLSRVIEEGFGSQRIMWLFLAAAADAALKLWDLFRTVDSTQTHDPD